MVEMKENRENHQTLDFYKGKRIFITGHTGFKGSWLCHILKNAGAIIKGMSLEPNIAPNLFTLSGLEENPDIQSIYADIRDLDTLKKEMIVFKPDIVIHMAAQPLVRESYKDPVTTYETNVLGTVNVLEALRYCPNVKSFLNVTTDKVYENKEWCWGYRENEPLDGFDPYSNSKSCSELITHSYQKSFFQGKGIAISTARAGNVIGGGDFAEDRIVPDCMRAALAKETISVRNPNSIRPYQHVLEPLFAYLLICKAQYENPEKAGYYNVGPDEADCITTGELASSFCHYWGENCRWESKAMDGPHEANFLKLDCSKIKTALGWKPRWNVTRAIQETVAWAKAYESGESIPEVMEQQINTFINTLKTGGKANV